jgi:hypothetical protein
LDVFHLVSRQGIGWGYVVIVSQTWLQYGLKDTHD